MDVLIVGLILMLSLVGAVNLTKGVIVLLLSLARFAVPATHLSGQS